MEREKSKKEVLNLFNSKLKFNRDYLKELKEAWERWTKNPLPTTL